MCEFLLARIRRDFCHRSSRHFRSVGAEPDEALLAWRTGRFCVCVFPLVRLIDMITYSMYAVGAISGHFFDIIWRFVVNK